MRKLPLLLLLALCLQVMPVISQNQAFKSAIHAKLNFIDYGLLFDNNLKVGQGFEFAYFRNLAPALNIGVPLKLGLAKLPGTDDANTVTAGADLQFRLENMKGSAKVIPFAFGGVGYVVEKGNGHAQFPFGAGLHFRLSPYAFVNLQGEFRKALVDDRDNLQIGIGYVYLLHKAEKKPVPVDMLSLDMDKDGTLDSLDVCPTLAGPPTTMGCPDADNDGIGDTEDPCPDDAGPIETSGCPDYDNDGFADKTDDCPTDAGTLNGCPDADGDGLADKDDKCPNEMGSVGNMGCPESTDSDGDGTPDEEDLCPDKAGPNRGCPDTDGDGIADNFDTCPEEAGTVENNGCPEVKDTDGDGIIDSQDKCPNTPGLASNMGCPEEKIEERPAPSKTEEKPAPAKVVEKKEVTEAREKLATAARAVQFETAKAILKDASYDVLDEVVTLMRQNPSYSLSISGYTDDVGDDEGNLRLSQDRSKACYDYLMFRGIKADRIRFAGFGEARPIATNDTEKGREQNRRVEFELIVE